MGEVVFYIFDGAARTAGPLAPNFQLLRNACDLFAIAQPGQQQGRAWPAGEDVGELGKEIGAAAAVDGNAGHVRQVDFCFFEAIADGMGREAGPMFDAAEPLFFGGSEKNAVADDTSRGVSMIRIETQDNHVK